MSSSSTSVFEGPERSRRTEGPAEGEAQDQTTSNQQTEPQPTDAQSRLQECIATAEALDAQLEAASRRSRRPRRRATSDPSESEPSSPAERHSRKCKICNHPERDLIEADFIQWRYPGEITDMFRISYDALYRHATATGLFDLRRENVHLVVQKVLEEVEYVQEPTAAAILRAVRTLACLDSRGRWAEPPTTHIVVNSSAESTNPARVSDDAQNSNRKIYEKLEPEINHR
jgi:hypothetical protein